MTEAGSTQTQQTASQLAGLSRDLLRLVHAKNGDVAAAIGLAAAAGTAFAAGQIGIDGHQLTNAEGGIFPGRGNRA